MKIFVRIVIINLWVGSWMPFLYIAIKLSKYDYDKLEWYVALLFFLVAILVWVVAIGSSIFLYKIEDHDWIKQLD
ncbi:hypothetical protein DHD05_18525 [Arenibacter sp. N53]|nr:hypothetical protein [Arenibacter sp. N53]